MKALKTIAALLFLSLLAIVLIQPVLGADDEAPAANGDAVSETDPAPGETTGTGGEDAPEVAFTARYPRRCMRDARPAGHGYVAARLGERVRIGRPASRPLATVAVDGDVEWSPSGRFLAERGGRVFDQRGRPRGRLFFRPAEWRWSPVADCALAVTESGNLTFSVAGTNRRGIRLLRGAVSDLELSPNGRRLAVVLEGRGLWIANLRRSKLTQATDGDPSLIGWVSNRSVLYSKSKGSGRLRYATGSGKKTSVVPGATAGATLVRCRDRTLVVGLRSESSPSLAELSSRRGRVGQSPLPVTPAYDGFSGAACSPDGAFVAASAIARSGRRGPLVLLESDGTFVRELVSGRTASPQWSEDGLLFVRLGSGGRGRLWFIPTNGAPARTRYRVGGPGQYDRHAEG